jgi:hypothetical protein
MRGVTDEVRPVPRVKLRPGRARCRVDRGLFRYLEAGLKLVGPGAGGVGRVG